MPSIAIDRDAHVLRGFSDDVVVVVLGATDYQAQVVRDGLQARAEVDELHARVATLERDKQAADERWMEARRDRDAWRDKHDQAFVAGAELVAAKLAEVCRALTLVHDAERLDTVEEVLRALLPAREAELADPPAWLYDSPR